MGTCVLCGKKIEIENEKNLCVKCMNKMDDFEKEHIEKEKNFEAKYNSSNTISTILKVLSWIVFIGGFILGIIYGTSASQGSTYSLTSIIIIWVASLFSGMLLIGFSEIIKLLQILVDKK